MKFLKIFLCSVFAAILLVSNAVSVAAGNNKTVKIDNQKIDFDVAPQLINNRTMVPVRAIFEALGATVEWNEATQTVSSTRGDIKINLTIGAPMMFVNGLSVNLDSPACVLNNRTLVPVRAISEAFGVNVDWDSNSNSVLITTGEAPAGSSAAAADLGKSYQCYPGTNVPDYTAVTGVPIKEVSQEGDTCIYTYENVNVGEQGKIIDYAKYLFDTGWELFKKDENVLDMIWYLKKDKELVAISYSARTDEVYIAYIREL